MDKRKKVVSEALKKTLNLKESPRKDEVLSTDRNSSILCALLIIS